MFKTRITERLGIEYSILAGPMAYLSRAELGSAVSDAGGLGIFDRRHWARFMVGILRAGLGRLVVLGPG